MRKARESLVHRDKDLVFSDDQIHSASATSNSKKAKASASEQVQVRMEFPGNEYQRPKRATLSKGKFLSEASSFIWRPPYRKPNFDLVLALKNLRPAANFW